MCAQVIGCKWKGPILRHLLDGPKRFNELRKILPEVTQRTLTSALRDLEQYGIIYRKVYAEIPPKVEYSMSGLGTTLEPVLKVMESWGRSYLATPPEPAE
jgi:DNA-binding HxlR family transcriptional regulator